MVDPPYHWYRQQAEANLLGPSAARKRALVAAWRASGASREDVEASQQALRELHASAWRDDVPEEDRAWAEAYRESCAHWVIVHRRDAVAQSAYEAYLRSSDGLPDGEPAPPWAKPERPRLGTVAIRCGSRRGRARGRERARDGRGGRARVLGRALARGAAVGRRPGPGPLARGGPRRAEDVGGDGRPTPEALVAVAPSSDPDR